MGRKPVEQATPDLFSADEVRDASAASTIRISATKTSADTSKQRHILPKNLYDAVTRLSDDEFDQLLKATLVEAKRRGILPPRVETDSISVFRRPSNLVTKRSHVTNKSKRTQTDNAELPLTRGQVSAIRAAFKAGVKPSQIARHFRVSQSNVRKALASDGMTR